MSILCCFVHSADTNFHRISNLGGKYKELWDYDLSTYSKPTIVNIGYGNSFDTYEGGYKQVDNLVFIHITGKGEIPLFQGVGTVEVLNGMPKCKSDGLKCIGCSSTNQTLRGIRVENNSNSVSISVVTVASYNAHMNDIYSIDGFYEIE